MEIEEVRRLTLKPGDVLVIKVPIGLAAEVAKRALEMISRKFPDHRVMIVPADWSLETIRETEFFSEDPDDPARPRRSKREFRKLSPEDEAYLRSGGPLGPNPLDDSSPTTS